MNEVGGVIKAIAPAPLFSGIALIVSPGTVQRLRIAVSRTGAFPWDKPQQPSSPWLGVINKSRFLLHDGHYCVHRGAPFLLGSSGGGVPFALFLEHRTNVLRLCRWSRGTS